MLGTSHQLWRSELSPDPEREEDVVELAYILEPPMAAKIHSDGDQQQKQSRSISIEAAELNAKRKFTMGPLP